MIPRRPLGRTSLSVPILGFGVSGPHRAGVVSERSTIRLIHQAIEAGAGLFDTAPFYGQAQARLGRALKGVARNRFIAMSKVGTVRGPFGSSKDFSASGMRASLEGSLSELGIDALDVVFLHGPPIEGLPDASLAALAAARSAGLVRALGVSGRGPEIDACLRTGLFDVVQAPLDGNGWDTRAQAAGAGFMGIEVLRGAAEGWRHPVDGADLWYMARTLRNRGFTALTRRGADGKAACAALDGALRRPTVTSVVISTAKPSHLAALLEIAAALSPAPPPVGVARQIG